MVSLSRDHYIADAAIVWCFDNRFWPRFLNFLKQKGFKNFDPIIIAGGAKALGAQDSVSDTNFLLRQIETSVKLHGTSKVVLMTHEDCGAFGGSRAFNNDRGKELQTHHGILMAAEKAILGKFPSLQVESHFMEFEA